jgi:hypothetical protein
MGVNLSLAKLPALGVVANYSRDAVWPMVDLLVGIHARSTRPA